MRVLALDTTTPPGSAAVVADNDVLAEETGDRSRSHAERLPGELLAVLERAHCELSGIDVFALAVGPGSFTGLRIGIATMQGLAFVTGKPVVAISTLGALAEVGGEMLEPGSRVGVWMDAHRREVFSALFRVEGSKPYEVGRLVEIEPADVADPALVLERWRAGGVMPERIVGDGAMVYQSLLAGAPLTVPPRPLASIVGRMAIARARAGDVLDPGAIQPIYIRRPDAELARQNRLVDSGQARSAGTGPSRVP